MRVLKRGIAAVEQSTQEVQRGSRLAVSLELAARIWNARLRRELRSVDDVPAIARQLLARLGLGRRGARLGELAGNAPQLHHLRMAAEGEDQRHLQEQLKIVADVVGLMLLEAFGAVAALQQKSATRRHRGEFGLEVAHLLDEDERREVAQMALHLLECTLIRVLRDLEDRLAPPAI